MKAHHNQITGVTFQTRSCITIHDPDVLFIKGILVLYYPEVRELLDIKLFVDLDSDRRLSARGKKGLLLNLYAQAYHL